MSRLRPEHGSASRALLAATVCVLIAGCSTPDVNPHAPRANTGYVDFYTDSNEELSWQVKRGDGPSGELRIVFNEFDPVPGNILRLAAPPGESRFQLTVINRATEGPQTVAVQVNNGQVTPVHITLTGVGETSVQNREFSFRGSAKGYGRGTRIRTEQNQVYRVTAVAAEPQSYQPKERMTYFTAAAPE